MQVLDLVDMTTVGKLAERIAAALRAETPDRADAAQPIVLEEPETARETALFDQLERLIESDLDRAKEAVS